MRTYKGGVGGRNSSPKRPTSIPLPKLETYLNLRAGNQLKGWFPTHAQGRVSSSAEFLSSPYSLLHRVWHFQRLFVPGYTDSHWKSLYWLSTSCGCFACLEKIYEPKCLVISEIKCRKGILFFNRKKLIKLFLEKVCFEIEQGKPLSDAFHSTRENLL